MGDRGRQISEFEASLVYRVSSRTTRDTHRNADLKKKTTTKDKTATNKLGKDVYQADRGLISKLYNELKKVNARRSNNPIKNGVQT